MLNRKRFQRAFALAAVVAVSVGLAACGGDDSDSGSDDTAAADSATTAASGEAPSGEAISVGFVAVGPEGAWRAANEANMQETFSAENGFDLKYAPATNLDQKSQIDAFTSFVDEGVDVILLSATEGAGWEDSLKRAQEAEIPVILIDRGIEPDDNSLYVTRIAPDNFEVSANVAEWAVSEFPDGANYFVLEGPAGVSVVNERNRGWDSVMDSQSQFVKVGAQTANWSAEEGKSVMETVLKANDNDIQLVFAQNDEMGLGAALAVEEAGLVPGEDVKIATIDGTKGAMEALAAGRLSFVAEYNPLFGDTALDVVNKSLAGESVESYIIVPSDVFDSPEAAQEALPTRQY
jgi:simple sugar transport system substrate-binding protein